MAEIVKEEFNNGTVTIWFFIDNVRYHNEHKEIIEKEDQFVCYYSFKEPTILCLGEIIRDSKNQVIAMANKNNALNNAINHVIQKYNLK